MTSLLSLLVAYLALATSAGEDTDAVKSVSKSIVSAFSAVETPIAQAIAYVGSKECEHVKQIVGMSYEQVDGDEWKEPDLDTLKLEYKDSSVRVVYNISTAAKLIPVSPIFYPNQTLYIYVHGFTDNPGKTGFSTISDALFKDRNCNVLALDASVLLRWFYLRASTYVRFIGEKLGQVVAALVQNGVDPAAVHIVGHSLGAHISGFTGKTFSNLTGGKIGRISGLDPAGPCFSQVEPELRLNITDADFVDVVHSDGGVYGLKDAIGQVDYYPNGGESQPNCPLQTCSHSRSWRYYAESIVNETAFPAVRCDSWESFKAGRCDYNVISYMGFGSKANTTGKYYLQTSDETPFGLGEKGLKYENSNSIATLFG